MPKKSFFFKCGNCEQWTPGLHSEIGARGGKVRLFKIEGGGAMCLHALFLSGWLSRDIQ